MIALIMYEIANCCAPLVSEVPFSSLLGRAVGMRNCGVACLSLNGTEVDRMSNRGVVCLK